MIVYMYDDELEEEIVVESPGPASGGYGQEVDDESEETFELQQDWPHLILSRYSRHACEKRKDFVACCFFFVSLSFVKKTTFEINFLPVDRRNFPRPTPVPINMYLNTR